jgi:hypothetical protein
MDEFTLSICQSNPQSGNQILEPVTQSFVDWCEQFSTPEIGEKHGPYFVRGPATKRSNADLKYADVAILDADSSIDLETGKTHEGAPPPIHVHEVLKQHDIQHIIYTSHSHGTKGNRYRVVVPLKLANKEQLAAVTDWLISICHQEGVYLANATENNNWSQPWYSPRVPAGSESQFEFYQHDTEEEIDVPSIMAEWRKQNAGQSIPPRTTTETTPDPESPIGRYNAEHGNPEAISGFLIEQGYAFMATCMVNDEIAYRILSPESSSGLPGCLLFKTEKGVWRVYSHHDDIIGKTMQAHDAFSLFALFHHDGDQNAALEAISDSRSKASERVFDLSWTDDYILTQEQAEQFEDPCWAYENLVVQGHVHAYPAEPNGGKTTVFFYLIAPMLVQAGYEVYYVNADISGSDAKQMVRFAQEKGFKLLLPDVAGKSMSQVVDRITGLTKTDLNFNKVVFIFDTLKKMTDVIQKRQSKELYSTLRQLSAKGMTICLLAHTNKHKDKDGNPMYEGTGDLRADVDNLIYMIPYKDEAVGVLTVSTKPDKRRAAFEPITFEIDQKRNVIQSDEYVNTAAKSGKKKQQYKDEPYIQAICEAIDAKFTNQKDIIKYCHDELGMPVRAIRRVLDTYGKKDLKRDGKRLPCQSDDVMWSVTKGDKNAWIYETLPNPAADFAEKLKKARNG